MNYFMTRGVSLSGNLLIILAWATSRGSFDAVTDGRGDSPPGREHAPASFSSSERIGCEFENAQEGFPKVRGWA